MQIVYGHCAWAVWALLTGADHHHPAGNAANFIIDWHPDGYHSGRLEIDDDGLATNGGGSSTEHARIRLALSVLDGARWPVNLEGVLAGSSWDTGNTALLTEVFASLIGRAW